MNQCGRCGAATQHRIQIDDTELLDCDRCGHVGVAAAPESPVSEPQLKRTRYWGWGSGLFILFCVVLGSGIFGFLAASGQGWTHPQLARLQQPLCELTLCNLYDQETAPTERWAIEQTTVRSLPDGTRLNAQLNALHTASADKPQLQLVVIEPSGQTLTRVLTPAQYLGDRGIELDLALPVTAIASVELTPISQPHKTIAQRD